MLKKKKYYHKNKIAALKTNAPHQENFHMLPALLCSLEARVNSHRIWPAFNVCPKKQLSVSGGSGVESLWPDCLRQADWQQTFIESKIFFMSAGGNQQCNILGPAWQVRAICHSLLSWSINADTVKEMTCSVYRVMLLWFKLLSVQITSHWSTLGGLEKPFRWSVR